MEMSEKGIVIDIIGEDALVEMTRSEACSKCRACITSLNDSNSKMMLQANNSEGAKKGDTVNIEVSIDGFFSAVMIMYSIPLAGLIIGLAIGYLVGGNIAFLEPYKEITAFCVGVVIMLISFLLIRKNEHKREGKLKYKPRIIGVVNSGNNTNSF